MTCFYRVMLQQILQTVTPKEAAPASEPAKSQDKTTKSLFAKLMGVLNMDIKAQKTAPETPENKLQAIATAENKTNQVAEKELNRLTFHKLTNSNPEKELSSLDREGEEKGEDISMPPVAIPVTGIVKTRTTVALGKAVNGQRNNDTGASGKLITKTAKIRIQTGKTPSENKLNLIKQESQTGLGKGDALPPDSKGVSKPVVIEATPKSDIQSSDTSSSTLARVTTKQAKVTRPGAISPSSTSVMPKPESAVKTPTHTSTRTEAAIEQKQIITSAKHQTNEDSHIRPAISDHPSPVAPQTAHKKPNITSGSYQMMASAENLNIGKNPRSIYTSSHKSHIPSPEVKKAVVLQQIAPTPIFGESELSGGNSGLNFSGRFADPGNSLIFNTSGLEPASTAVAQTNSRASISRPGFRAMERRRSHAGNRTRRSRGPISSETGSGTRSFG